jgi:aspartate/methionine/tyrosine aminotransferase
MDEFYGGYNYTSNCDGTTISAAENIDDVDEDDVLIIDGLTKRFRLPGWRIAWIVGPKVCPHLNSYPAYHRKKDPHVNNPRNSSKQLAPVDPTWTGEPTFLSKKPPFPCWNQQKCALR